MADRPPSKADQVFTASQQRDDLVKEAIAKEHEKALIKMAKLRELRMEKEAADRAKAQAQPFPTPSAKRARKRSEPG